MRTTVTLDDELLAQASEAMGTTDVSLLLHEGLRLIVQGEAARRLILLGGSAPGLRLPPRRRSAVARKKAPAGAFVNRPLKGFSSGGGGA